MKDLRIGRTAAALSIGVLALGLAACGSDNNTGAGQASGSSASSTSDPVSGTLSGSGSSAQQAAVTAWQSGFSSANSNAQVQYSPDGSGAGREAFLSGATQFAGSDAYLTDDELTKSKDVCGPNGAIDVPVYISPIAVAYNLKDVKDLKLDAPTIAKIFQGEITTWNDPAIAALNSGATLPDTKITPVHRSDKSGTTENFTDYLAAAAPSVWTEKASQEWPSSLSGEAAKGTSGVVSTTTSTDGAITYADDSAVDSLGKAQIKVGESFVPISAEGAAKAVDVSKPVEGRPANDIAIALDRTSTEAGVYPIVLVSYQIYCSSYKDQSGADLVKAWGDYVVSPDGQKTAADAAKSAPLSASLSEKAQKSIATITSGK